MITQERLKELFDYRDDGHLVWKKSACKRIKHGDVLGCLTKAGYRTCTVDGKNHLVHRLVFLYHHGYMPQYVDHINSVRSDNRISNIRSATKSQNQANTKKKETNKSGLKGVSYHPEMRKKWFARITVNYKQKVIGYFETPEEAHAAYCKEAKEHFGEFARFK